MAMPDITDEKLALIEYDESEASDDDIAAIISRLRKAEAERDALRAKVEKLRMAMRELRDWLQGSCRADGDSEKAAALALANAALAETETNCEIAIDLDCN